MDHKVLNIVLCAIVALALGCNGGSGDDSTPIYPLLGTGGMISASGGTTSQPYDTGGSTGTGGMSTASDAGAGSTSDASSSSDPTDSTMARQIAIAAREATVFLWSRDMNSLGKSPFSVSDICLLTGSYSAKGTRDFLNTGCFGTASTNINFVMDICEHQATAGDDSVIFSGELLDQWTATYAGSCSAPEATSQTITATGMTVTFKRASTGFEKTFTSCAIELNYSQNTANPPAKMSGRVCGISVSVTYSS